MEASRFFASINFLLILPFILLLNSFTNGLSLYLLFLTIFLNSCINFFIVFPLYSNFLSSATFTVFSSPLPNSFLNTVKNFPTVSFLPPPVSLSHSLSKYPLTLPTHMTRSKTLILLPLFFSFSFSNIVYI